VNGTAHTVHYLFMLLDNMQVIDGQAKEVGWRSSEAARRTSAHPRTRPRMMRPSSLSASFMVYPHIPIMLWQRNMLPIEMTEGE